MSTKCKQAATFTKRGKRLSAPHLALWANVRFEDGRALRMQVGQDEARAGAERGVVTFGSASGTATTAGRVISSTFHYTPSTRYVYPPGAFASAAHVIRACTCSQTSDDNPNCRWHGRSRER
jgi:hypothetical protein